MPNNQQISVLKLIREQDADELLASFMLLKNDYYANYDSIKEIKKQYRQLTGEDIYQFHKTIITL